MQLYAFQMGRLRRIVIQGSAAEHQHGRIATTADNGGIHPMVAQGLPALTQHISGASLATGGPPVQNLDVTGGCRCAKQRDEQSHRQAHG